MMLSPSSKRGGTERKRPAWDIGDDLAPRLNFQALLLKRHRQGDAHGVADALREQLLKGHARFDDALGRHPGLGDAEVEGHVGALGGEAAVGFHDLAVVGVLKRDDVALEAEAVQDGAMFERAGDNGGHVVVAVALLDARVDGAAVHAHAQGAVVTFGGLRDESDLLLHRLVLFVVMEMAGVVAQLVDMRRHLGTEPVVLL